MIINLSVSLTKNFICCLFANGERFVLYALVDGKIT